MQDRNDLPSRKTHRASSEIVVGTIACAGFLLPKTKSGIESLVHGWLSYPDQDTFGQHTKHRQQERQSTQIPARSTTINSTIPAIPHTCKLSYTHKIMQASKSHEYNSVLYIRNLSCREICQYSPTSPIIFLNNIIVTYISHLVCVATVSWVVSTALY